jgi:hypothetical protein
MKLHGLVPNSYIHVSVSDINIFPGSVCLFANRQTDPWEYNNPSQMHECENWETEQYNYVLEITRLQSFISGNT